MEIQEDQCPKCGDELEVKYMCRGYPACHYTRNNTYESRVCNKLYTFRVWVKFASIANPLIFLVFVFPDFVEIGYQKEAFIICIFIEGILLSMFALCSIVLSRE